jgi:hypothetical protein
VGVVTSGKGPLRTLLLLGVTAVAAGVCTTGCTPQRHTLASPSIVTAVTTASPSRTVSSPSPAPAPTVAGGVALVKPPCSVALPAAWQSGLTRGALWHGLPDSQATGAPAPDTAAVLHQANSAGTARFALVGVGQHVIQSIGSLARPAGAQFAYTAVTSRYVAFVYSLTNGQQAQNNWDLYLFDRSSKHLTRVARNPHDASGAPLPGGWVQPVLTDRYLYWIQAAKTTLPWGGSDIKQYELATGRIKTVYHGLANAIVVADSKLLFTAVVPDASTKLEAPPMGVSAVDQVSGRPVGVPAGITAGSDGAFTIEYSAGTLIWNTSKGAIRGWNQQWGRSITLVPALDDWPLGQQLGLSGPAYPRIYHQYVIWQPGKTYVLDLKTNSFTALSRAPGGEELSGSHLAIEQYSSTAEPARVGTYAFDQTVLDLALLPDLGLCS